MNVVCRFFVIFAPAFSRKVKMHFDIVGILNIRIQF